MKKYKTLILLITCIFCSGILTAETVHVSTGVPAMGSKEGTSSLSIKTYWWNDDVLDTNFRVDFGNQPADAGWARPNQYIKLDVSCNYALWKVDIYTNNNDIITVASTGTAQRAGLLDDYYWNSTQNKFNAEYSSNVARVPLAWVVSISTDPTKNSIGVNPNYNTTVQVKGSTATISASWAYVKDKGDKDDPSIDGDQSWSGCHNVGYTVVAYGGPNYINLCYGLEAQSPLYVFVIGDWGSAAGGKDYKTAGIWFDLYTP